jgi:8-oxo-dGTP pyrophosphatase MutT (NUDIX family)
VAGHIEFGKSPLEEMKREAIEEVGLKNSELTYLGKELIRDGEERYFKYWFTTHVRSDYAFVLNPEEVDEVTWFTPETLKASVSQEEMFNQVFVKRARLFWHGSIKKGLL